MIDWFKSLFGFGAVCKTKDCTGNPKHYGYCDGCWYMNHDWMIKPRIYHDS